MEIFDTLLIFSDILHNSAGADLRFCSWELLEHLLPPQGGSGRLLGCTGRQTLLLGLFASAAEFDHHQVLILLYFLVEEDNLPNSFVQ